MGQPTYPNGNIVLIAEDSRDDLGFLIRAFKGAGILNPLQTVHSGDEAISYLEGAGKYADREEFPFPTILFLDWVLPGRSGEDVLAWLRMRPERQRLLVVVLTGQEQRRRMMDAYRLGADSFLPKPVTIPDLMNLVAHFKPFWIVEASPPKDHGADPLAILPLVAESDSSGPQVDQNKIDRKATN